MLTPAHHAQLNTDRRMRIGGQSEDIARKAVEGHAALQIDFFDALMQLPMFASIDRTQIKSLENPEAHHGCDCHPLPVYSDEKAAFHGNAIAGIRRAFIEVLGETNANRIFAAAGIWEALSTGDGSPLGIGYRSMINEAAKWAFGNVTRQWEKLPKAMQRGTPKPSGPMLFDSRTAWIEKLERYGFTLVRDSITKEMLPKIQHLIVNGARANVPAMQLANELNAYVGSGGLYRVRRLIRTEMAMAIDKSSTAQYKENGISFVKWNASINACPICAGIARSNMGYYSIDNVPSITADTHPNCLCNKTPVYRLPKGITV